MSDNDGLLSEAEMHRVYDVAAAVNALDARLRRVEALRRQFEQHIVAEDGAEPVEGEADPVEGDTLDLDAIESRAHRLMVATWECDKLSYTDQWQMVRCDVPSLVDEVRALQARVTELRDDLECSRAATDRALGLAAEVRAERDAAQARVAELEKEDTERLERGREKARHMEKGIATLKHAVREARENLDYGHIWTPNDTQYVRDAIAALSAALDEEATDAE